MSTASPMIPEFRTCGGADQIGAQNEDGVLVEVGGQPLLGQLDPIALDAGEA